MQAAPPLVAVGLDDGAFVEERAVVLVVLLRVVGVDGVRYVRGHQERLSDRHLDRGLTTGDRGPRVKS